MEENKLGELWKRTYDYIKTNDVTFLGGKKRKGKQSGGNKFKEVSLAVYDAFITTLLIIVVLLKIGKNPSYKNNIDNLIQDPEQVVNLAVDPEMQQALVLVKNARPMIQNENMPSSQEMLVFLRDALQGIGMRELNRALLTMLPLSKQDKAGYQTFETMRQARQMAEYAKSLRDSAAQLNIGDISDFYPLEESNQNRTSSSGDVGSNILSHFKALPRGTSAKTISQRVKERGNRYTIPKTISFDEVYDEQPFGDYTNPLKSNKTIENLPFLGVEDIQDGGKRKKVKTNKRRTQKRRTQKRRTQKRRRCGRKTRRYY
jgi:hypothetical protein